MYPDRKTHDKAAVPIAQRQDEGLPSPGPASPVGAAVSFALVFLSSCVPVRPRLFSTVLAPGNYLNAGAGPLPGPFAYKPTIFNLVYHTFS